MRQRKKPQAVEPKPPPATTAPAPAIATSHDFCAPLQHRGLRWFRRAFCLLLLHDAYVVVSRGEMADFFGEPNRINFVYDVAPWVRPLDAAAMERLPHVIGAAVVLVGTGIAPCCGLLVAMVAQAYLFAVEAARYVNHLYLYVLLSTLLLLAAADTPRGSDCRWWHLRLLRLQMCVVYFYGGVAKCNHTWLVEGEPLRAFLAMAVEPGRPLRPLHGVLDSEAGVVCGAAIAALYDLAAPLALWFGPDRARLAAFTLGLLFHGGNSLMFPTIHSFPFVCTAAYALFLQPDHDVSATKAAAAAAAAAASRASSAPAPAWRVAVSTGMAACWAGVQLLLPLRYHMQSDDVAWSKLGDTFSWRMMADVTDGWVSVQLTPPLLPGQPRLRNGPQGPTPHRTPPGMSPEAASPRPLQLHPQSANAAVTMPQHSIPLLLSSPSMLRQYVAAELAAACAGWRRRGAVDLGDGSYVPWPAATATAGAGSGAGSGRLEAVAAGCVPRVTVEAWKAVNGLPYQRWVDPTFDFGRIGDDAAAAAGGWWRVPPAWMLPRIRLGAEAEARARDEAGAWQRRGYTVEVFLDAPGRPPFVDRILPGAARRGEATLVALHGTTALQLGDAARSLVQGESAPLSVGREHVISCRGGGPCSWLYAMR